MCALHVLRTYLRRSSHVVFFQKWITLFQNLIQSIFMFGYHFHVEVNSLPAGGEIINLSQVGDTSLIDCVCGPKGLKMARL